MFTWCCQCSWGDVVSEGSAPLGELVKKVIKKLGGKGHLGEEEIINAWAFVVGRKAARHTKPVSFRKSVLLINVNESSWLYELTIRKKEILKGLAARLEGKKLKDIRFRIGEVK